MERMEAVEAKVVSWASEREELLKSLEAKEAILKEEASRAADLAADLEQAQVIVEHLREEAKEEATQMPTFTLTSIALGSRCHGWKKTCDPSVG